MVAISFLLFDETGTGDLVPCRMKRARHSCLSVNSLFRHLTDRIPVFPGMTLLIEATIYKENLSRFLFEL